MLCTIEDLKRILETQKNNITIGEDEDDSTTEANAEQSIREADVTIQGYLTGVYKFPLRNRILLNTTGLSATKSLVYQPETPRQLAIVVSGDGTMSDNNTIVIRGTDHNGTALYEGIKVTKSGSYVTANYFRSVNEDGIEIGSAFLALTDASITVLSYDILNYIAQRLASYNLYRDVFSANAPNETPDTVTTWKDQAEGYLQKIKDKMFSLDTQVAPDDIPILERPVYNIPTKFFEYRGVAGLERLEDASYQDYDGDHPHSIDSEGSSGLSLSIEQSVIIPPDTWTTGSRPAAPYVGQAGINTETGQFEGWNGTAWVLLG